MIGERYLVERELGRGGMARVYRARDLKIGRAVAVKVLAAGGRRERFQKEARAAGALNHPNIVAVYDVGEHGGEPYIVSELLEGQTLREVLAERTLTPDEVLEFALQLASGLAAAHRKGIVHRDLKPDNLFVTEDGRLKILDFGIARLLDVAQLRTDTGAEIGTPAYMSPEQARCERVDARSDVFSLGVVLYEMLSGRSPFVRATVWETAYAIVNETLPRLPDTPLSRIVARCLEKDPAARYESAAEVLAALRGTPARPSLRLRRNVTVIAAAITISFIALEAVLLWRGRQRETAPRRDVIAVFPFSVHSAAESRYLGEGMVDLLSATLSDSTRRTVDAPTLLATVAKEKKWTGDPEQARAVATRFGANAYVLGSLVEISNRFRIHAALYSVGGGSEPVRDATVEGEPARLFGLIDDLSSHLRGPSANSRDDAVQLAQMTNSPAAVKAYLEGRQEERRFHIAEAVAAYDRALAADPSFALARFYLYRTLEAGAQWDRGDAEAKRALAMQDRLPFVPRLRIQTKAAMMRGDRAEAFRLANEAVRAAPDDWETLQDLWLYLWMWSYLDGRPFSEVARVADRMQQARTADREAMNTNDTYFVAGEYERAREVIEDQLARGAIFDEKVRLRSRFAIALVTGDEATRAAILKELPEQVPVVGKGFSPGFRQFFMSALLVPGGIRSAEEIVRLASERDHALGVGLGLHLSLVQGRLVAARKLAEEELASIRERQTSSYGAPALSAGDRWTQLYATGFSEELAEIGAIPDATQLASDRQAVLALDAKDDLFVRVMRTFMLGRLSALLGDAAEAERWASELERMVTPPNGSIGADLALWIRATLAWKAGRLHDALRLTEAVRAQLPGENNSFGSRIWLHPHVWLPINYGRAELLFQLGRYDEAERWFSTSIRHTGREFRPQRFRRLGQIAARRGDKAKAVAYLSHFVEMRGDCDPELRPQVDEARTLLATLR